MPLPSGLASLMSAIPAMPRAAGGGGPSPVPQGPMAPPGAGPSVGEGPSADPMFAEIANKQFSDSSGSDPKMVVDQLSQVKTILAALFPKVAFRIPGIDKHLTATYRSLDAALDAATEAQQLQTQAAPIMNDAASAGPVGSPQGLP